MVPFQQASFTYSHFHEKVKQNIVK